MINSGLLQAAKSSNDVAAVLAHEIGHLKAGHIFRASEADRKGMMGQLLSLAGGIAAGIASGRPDVAAAVVMAGSHSSMATQMAYRRSEEIAADLIAIDLLRKNNVSPEHLIQILNGTGIDSRLNQADMASYFSTHPPTAERIAIIRQHMTPSMPNEQLVDDRTFKRMRAKLDGFLLPIDRIKDSQDRYVRAIAEYRRQNFEKAYSIIAEIMADEPDNHYLIELKADMMLNQGNVKQALNLYQQAFKKNSRSLPMALSLARASIAANQDLKQTSDILESFIQDHQRSPPLWAYLEILYGRQGLMGASRAAKAELAYLSGRQKEAATIAKSAIPELSQKKLLLKRMQDLLFAFDSASN